MKQEYIDKIIQGGNGWIFDEDYKANLIMSDDLDSMISCLLLLSRRPNMQIGYFYDFRDGLYVKHGIDESLDVIGVDLSHPSIKCISNHLTATKPGDYNPYDINLNNLDSVTLSNYHSKYNLNTLILVYSLLGLKPKTDVEKAILLCPDSAFLPAYQPDYYKDKHIQKKYLCDVLELPELWEFQQHNTKDKFLRFQDILHIKSKLYVSDKGIETMENVDLEMICKYLNIDFCPSILEGLFMLKERHQSFKGSPWQKYDKSDFFSFAITSKSTCKWSKAIHS